jgi:glyoxylase-like metal-dependent hydrolase (beta-lactamase superfamily II)
MMKRRYLFEKYPVIEMNLQAGRRIGCNVYLVDGGSEYLLIDIGYLETVPEIIDMIRRMDFPLAACRMIVATHADADHTQGLARAKELLHTNVAAHPLAVEPLETGDQVITYALIKAQDIDIPMPRCRVDMRLNEGDVIEVGDQELEVWHTPGHAMGQLALRMGELLFSGDNICRDSSVGVIDAHHGSNIPDFIKSLERIRDCDARFLLPSHGPIFRKDNGIMQKAIDRLTGYQYLADFGTCTVHWPLMEEWEREIMQGVLPS